MPDTKTLQDETAIERAIERLAEESRAREVPKNTPEPVSTPEISESESPTAEAVQAEPHTVREIAIEFRRLENHGIFAPGRVPNRTTEEFRLIKRSVLLNVQAARAAQSKNSNLIMVTSVRQGEGKSFVSFNLALSLAAEINTTVLLIDADPSRASILGHLGVEAEKGLIDLLRDGEDKFSDVLLKTNVEQLAILPAGEPDPLSSELLASSRAANLLDEISRRYDIVILDAPPALATTETTGLALHVGQIIFVVDAGKTTKSAIKESLNLIRACANVGFVLNRAEFQFGSTRFGSYYKYYKKSYTKYRKTVRP